MPKKIKITLCKYCGEVARDKHQKPFCSIGCRQKMERDFPEQFDSIHNISCKECGQNFLSKMPHAKYCSDKCRQIANNRNITKIPSDFLVFERDNFRCVYCGKSSIEDGVKLAVEHIFPVKRGGQADLVNLVTACTSCNGQKSSIIMSDDNILRLWNEVARRSESSPVGHYEELLEKFEKSTEYRRARILIKRT